MKNPEFTTPETKPTPDKEKDAFLEQKKQGWLQEAQIYLDIDPTHLEAFKDILDECDAKNMDEEEVKLLREYQDAPEPSPKMEGKEYFVGRHMVIREGRRAEEPAYDVVFRNGLKIIIDRDKADKIVREYDPNSSSFHLWEYDLRCRGGFDVDGKKMEAARKLSNRVKEELKEELKEKKST